MRVLVDCGLFQGADEDRDNAADPGFDAARIDCLLLTHAHLDHCGRLPLLVKRGFRGTVFATAATADLAQVVLQDSARLQDEEARRDARHAAARHRELEARPALYSTADADAAQQRFGPAVRYGEPVRVGPGLQATFLDAGHILGSASIVLEVEEGGRSRRFLFSGDLGNRGRPLLRDPVAPSGVDVVVMETTYGDRRHRPITASVDELCDAVAQTFGRGGNVIIPAFALERSQEILFHIRQATESGRLPRATQVFLDSPMAISATEIFRRHPECYDEETASLFAAGRDPFHLPGLHFTHDAGESMVINRVTGGAIIMAGSGMCTGGRVLYHLAHNLGREQASVIFVGFAARGTLARQIIDGARHVRIHGEDVPVRARIHTINGFSAHADQAELLAWHAQTGEPQRTFLVHGEAEVMAAFAARLPGAVSMPQLHETVEL